MFKDKLNYFFLILIFLFAPIILTPFYQIKSEEKYDEQPSRDLNIRKGYSNINWEEIRDEKPVYKESENKEINSSLRWKHKVDLFEKTPYIWQRVNKKIELREKKFKKNRIISLNTLNRSIVFNDNIVGPDVSFLVPPAFLWSKKYNFDTSIRGHNRRKKGEKFLGWNKGDAVGQIHFQPFNNKDRSFGINFGIRSVYQGSMAGGGTEIGEGQSLGFRYDRKLPNNGGFSFGAEQFIHFDALTDTGRDIYITFSKGWWKNPDSYNPFPLYVGTFGLGTGKMAEGNIKGLCSDFFDGSGTENSAYRRLCWAPIFSVARVENEKLSTFFEYNSKWFLLGGSLSPFKNIPMRGTFAVQLSDHIENYKLNNIDNMKWIFRLSYGF